MILMRDRLDVLFEDEDFAELYPRDGRPGLPPEYSLGVELDDPRFDHSVLCEFRARRDAADRLPHVMLNRLVEAGLLKAGCHPRARRRPQA